MKSRLALFIGLFLSFLAVMTASSSYGRGPSVIMRQTEPGVIPTMSDDTVLLIFTGRQPWFNGQKLTLVVFNKNSPEHKAFVYEILGITAYQYNSRLNKQVYAGRIKPPIVVNSTRQMIEMIRRTPNTIGYIPNIDAVARKEGIVVVDIVK